MGAELEPGSLVYYSRKKLIKASMNRHQINVLASIPRIGQKIIKTNEGSKKSLVVRTKMR
jgi:hypothetical protein